MEQDFRNNREILFIGFETLLEKGVKGRPLEVFDPDENLLGQRIYLDRIKPWQNQMGLHRLLLRGFTMLYPGDIAEIKYFPIDKNEDREVKVLIYNDPETLTTLADRQQN